MSQQQLDQAKMNYDSSKASEKAAAASITQAEAQASQKKAALAVAQTNLDYTVIRSPINGTVVARNVDVPIIGIGGIATLDDVMEFLVAGASAVQLGTVNFYDPTAAPRVVAQLPEALAKLGAGEVREVVGTLV